MHDKKEILLSIEGNRLIVSVLSSESKQSIDITPVFYFLKDMFSEIKESESSKITNNE